MNPRCLACYEKLEVSSYHPSCVKRVFGVSWIPTFDFAQKDFGLLAQKMAGQMSISGVQPKITVGLNKKNKNFEIFPSGGSYILKPQTQTYEHLPENEDLCMHLAKVYEIIIPTHTLVKTADGVLAYLIKRFDILEDGHRLPVEDFGQILGMPAERKYSGSYEAIAKGILQYCSNKYLELTRFFERLLFCFVLGNGDMHLKNFSLVTYPDQTVVLSPAYDLLSSKLVIPDEEDLPISLLGKKNKLKGQDFLNFGDQLGLARKAMKNSIERLLSLVPQFQEWVQKSFLLEEEKENLNVIIDARANRLKS